MKKIINKFTSRKFIAAVTGIFTGLGLIVTGNTTEGVTTILTSIIAYLIAEGYIDAKAVKATTETAEKANGDGND